MKKSILIYVFLLMFSSTFAQQLQPVELEGKVIDEETGEILQGVNLFLRERPNIGTITDSKGKFTFKVTEGDVVIASLVGYKNYEYLAIKSVPDLEIKMQLDVEEIESVVVTGLGTPQRRISVVGAVSSIDVSELQTPATSIANMLGGRVPGIISRLNSGEPGSNISEFWIRGIGTFGGGNSALVLIDDLEGSLDNIDPADIETFTILKDASATAIYGTRGANGVILITTKRGVTDKLQIAGRVNMKLSYLPRTPEYLRAYDYAVLANEARVVRGDDPLYSNEELYIIKNHMDPDLYPDVNWRDELLDPTAFQQTYYVSAQGGTKTARYFVSLGASNEGTVYKKAPDSKYMDQTGYGKYTYRTNVDMNITSTSEVRFSLDGEFTKRTVPGIDNTNTLWYMQLRLTPLLMPTRYSTGQLPAYNGESYSPYVMLNHTGTATYENSVNRINLEEKQDLSFITPGLKFRILGSLEVAGNKYERRFVRPEMWYASKRNVNGDLVMVRTMEKMSPVYTTTQTQNTKLLLESRLSYQTSFNRIHRIDATLLYSMDNRKIMTQTQTSSIGALPYRMQKFAGRVLYGLKETYFAEANFGYQGSANFQKGRRFGFFPSIGGAWVPTQYQAVKDAEWLSWLSFFKIRSSYGLVGNDAIAGGRFPYLTSINENAGTGWGYGEAGISENSIGADNLRWEASKKSDLGIEIKLFKNKVDINMDWFNDQRDGIFQTRAQIPDYVGLTNLPYGNVGRMRSYGGEGNIAYHLDINKDLHITLRANYTYWSNLIQNYERVTQAYPYFEYHNWPSGIQRGYVYLGLFRDEDDIASSPFQDTGAKVMPGDLKYKDVNGDGTVNDDDRVPLSYEDIPRMQYGLGMEVQYKDLTVGVRFVGTGRTDFYYTTNTNSLGGQFGGSWGTGYIPFERAEYGNVLTMLQDQSLRWTPESYSGTKATENPNAKFPRMSYGNNHNNNKVSDYWKGDSRYLRLSEVTINYRLKPKIFQAIGLSAIDLSLVGNNLYVWDRIFHHIFDPEQARFMGQQYPIPSSVILQAYIHF
ncbi:MAG: TonB-dependent receptor [Prevotellaceae bacterium]|jgi:TonB-linked SusC/RagA family outer membrane protein|nr:TonB-dependent receptor [Prevotellaceae bacterium]